MQDDKNPKPPLGYRLLETGEWAVPKEPEVVKGPEAEYLCPPGYRWAPMGYRLLQTSWWLHPEAGHWKACQAGDDYMPRVVIDDKVALPPDPPAGYRLLVPGETIPDYGVLYHDQFSLTWEPKADGVSPVEMKFDPAATHRPLAVPDTGSEFVVEGYSLAPELEVRKPPPGICPRWLHEEIRMDNLIRCIARYREEGQPAKSEWYDELRELLDRRLKVNIEANNG